MVILTYFVDIDNAVENERDGKNDGDMNSVIFICHDYGKSSLICTAYQNCRSYTRYEHSKG